jgi:hypothetical protein
LRQNGKEEGRGATYVQSGGVNGGGAELALDGVGEREDGKNHLGDVVAVEEILSLELVAGGHAQLLHNLQEVVDVFLKLGG